jgi:hypothetical protein
MPIEPLDLARRLIAIPSPSGAEGEVGRFLVPILEGIGLHVALQPVAADRFNLLATAGAGAPDVILCTHIDVVPPHIPPRETGKGHSVTCSIRTGGSLTMRSIISTKINSPGSGSGLTSGSPGLK